MFEYAIGRPLQRLVVYSALGLCLAAVDINWDNELFWCTLVLVWVLEYLARQDGRSQGVSDVMYMSEHQLVQLHRLMASIEAGNEHTVDEINEIMNKPKDKE